jgi:hypothetical protein
MNPLNADQREQQLTRLLEAVSKERDAALAQLELERREKGELVAKLLEGIDLRLQHYDVERAKEVDSLAAGNEDADPCAWGYAKIAVIGVREDIKRLAAITPQEAPDGR